MSKTRLAGILTVGLAGSTALSAAPLQAPAERPSGYEQVVPRGAIAAIDDPVYLPAAEARVRDDAWVLGVVIEGQARAYSLELLNSHEIVNDTIGNTDFAAVW